MTHRERPWIAARERAGVGELDRSTEELDDNDIAEYFEALLAADGEER